MPFRPTKIVLLALHPLPILLARFDHTVHEAHAQQAIQRIGEVERQRVGLRAGAAGGDGFGGVGIQVGETLGEALRVAGHEPRCARRQRQRAGSVGGAVLGRAVQWLEGQ